LMAVSSPVRISLSVSISFALPFMSQPSQGEMQVIGERRFVPRAKITERAEKERGAARSPRLGRGLLGGGAEGLLLREEGGDLGSAGRAAAAGAGFADDVLHGLRAVASELQNGPVGDSSAVTDDHRSRSSWERLPEVRLSDSENCFQDQKRRKAS
jgi:hypothetical protein